MQHELFGNYPIFYLKEEIGTLQISREGLRALFHASCQVNTSDILKLSIQSNKQHISLGVMMPKENILTFTKHFTKHDLQMRGISSIDTAFLLAPGDSLPPILHQETPPPAIKPVVAVTSPNTPPVAPIPEVPTMPVLTPFTPPEPPAPPMAMPTEQKAEIKALKDHLKQEEKANTPPQVFPQTKLDTFTPPIIPPAPMVKVPTDTIVPPSSDWEFIDTWGKVETDGLSSYTLHPPSPIVKEETVQDVNPYPHTAVTDIEVSQWSTVATPSPAPKHDWYPYEHMNGFFTDPLLQTASSGITGGLIKQVDHTLHLAVPFESGAPFPLMPVFCKGTPTQIKEKTYLVFQIEKGNIL